MGVGGDNLKNFYNNFYALHEKVTIYIDRRDLEITEKNSFKVPLAH